MNISSAHSPRRLQCTIVPLNFIGATKNAAWRGRVPFCDYLLLLYQAEIGKPANFAELYLD